MEEIQDFGQIDYLMLSFLFRLIFFYSQPTIAGLCPISGMGNGMQQTSGYIFPRKRCSSQDLSPSYGV